MSSDCRRIEEALAEGRELKDDLLAHVESCEACRQLIDELGRLDEDLAELSPEPVDDLAQRVRAAVEQADPDHPERTGVAAFLTRRVLVAAATFLFMGAVLTVILPNLFVALDRVEQKRTMGDMRTIATAVESYSLDNNQYPADSGETVVTIASYLEPSYMKKLPTDEGWETSLDRAAPDDVWRLQQEALERELEQRGQPEALMKRSASESRKRGEEERRRREAERARYEAERKRREREAAESARFARLKAEANKPEPAPATEPAPPPAEFPGTLERSFNYMRGHDAQAVPVAPAEVEAEPAKDIAFSTGSFVAYPEGAREDGAEQAKSRARAKAPAATTARIEEFKPITGGFQAEYGEQSKGLSGSLDKVTDPDEEVDDISIAGGYDAQVGYRLEGLEADAEKKNEDQARDPFELVRARNQIRHPETGKKQDRDGFADAKLRSNEDLLAQMGYGVLGHEPEEWANVSLDRPVYFENTYLGGNARLAWLDRRAEGLSLQGKPVAPHREARWPAQPFDAPESGAVALHVDASEAHAPGGQKKRVYLQVGIAGTEDAAWRRPPTSLVVLPLLLSEVREAELSAIVQSVKAGLDPRDLLALPTGDGLPKFTAPELASGSVTLDAAEARATIRAMARGFWAEEAGSADRTRRLLIIADRPLDEKIRRRVHQLALKDVVTSVITVGRPTGETLDSHAAVAQSGLGNLHLAPDAPDLTRAIGDELESLTRVVARALRLNIQPADGVRLIQVLGSRPLGRREVKEVKAREAAVDAAVERSTGIASDRGDDDPGLQTVLPYFLAGDTHLVIVELEVDGPGPLADVSLKIKDLVEMENRSLRASASLSRTPAEPNPRQLHVRRNVTGFAVAKLLHFLENEAVIGGDDQAQRVMALAQQLRAEAGSAFEADARLLETYARLIQQGRFEAEIRASIECSRRARLGRSSN